MKFSEARLEALREASKHWEPGDSPEQVLARAAAYYEYLVRG